MVRTSNPLVENSSSAEGTSAKGASAEPLQKHNMKNLLKLMSVEIKFRRLLSIQRKSMLPFLAASAAEFLRLFIFDLDLFVENIVIRKN